MKNNLGIWLLIGAVAVVGIGYFYPYSSQLPAAESRASEAPVAEGGQKPTPAPMQPPVDSSVVTASEPAVEADWRGEETAVDKSLPPVLAENPQALLPDTRAAVNALVDTSHAGLEAEPLAGGGEKINLKKHFRSVSVATRQADGSVAVRDYVSQVPPPAAAPEREAHAESDEEDTKAD